MFSPGQVYLAECAEPGIRGLLVGLPTVAYSCGILLTYSLGAFLHWRTVAWVSIAPPAVALIAMLFVPESPSWLARKGHVDKAQKVLVWLRCDKHLAHAELQDISGRFDRENKQTPNDSQQTLWSLLSSPATLKPLLIIITFNCFVVIGGTYMVVLYIVEIIGEIAIDIDTMQAAVYSGTIRLLSTLGCSILLYNLNRRTLIIRSGLIASASCLTLVAFTFARANVLVKSSIDTYVSAVCLLVFVAALSTFMVMPGVLMSELLPAKVRGKFGGIIIFLFHGTLFLMAKVFPYFAKAAKTQGVFLLFGLTSFVASLFVYATLPETKGRTLGQIEDYFQGIDRSRKNRTQRKKKVTRK